MKKILLFTSLFILLFSVVALAEDDTSSSPAGVFPVGLYEDDIYDKLASGDTRAVEYTTTDIYNLLQSALNGSNYLSAYSLPQIASQIRRISTILYGSGQAVPSSGNLFDNITSYLSAYDSGSRVGLATLALNMQYDITDIKNANTGMSSSLSSINNKLSLFNSLNWVNRNAYSYAPRESLNGSDVSSGWYSHLFFRIVVPNVSDNPSFFRIFIPWSASGSYFSSPDLVVNSVRVWVNNSMVNTLGVSDYFTLVADNGIYLYLPDSHFNYSAGTYFLELTAPATMYYNSSYPVTVYSLPFDSYDYQILVTAFYQRLSSRSLSGIDKLVDVYASDDLIEAKQAQQAVEDSVLDDFTGSGSESLKLNDVSGVKQVSGQAKQFLGTGGSSGNALGLFNINGSGLWQWFSQTTANNLDTSPQTRSSDSYYFYDLNEQDYYNKLGASDVSESY